MALVFVLDLSQMSGRAPESRAIIVEATRGLAARARMAMVVPPVDASRVYIASIYTAASLARIFGLTVSVTTFPEAVRQLRVASLAPR